MLMCEYCLLWYHAKCEEVSGGILDELETYKCSYCNDWEGTRNKDFNQVLDN